MMAFARYLKEDILDARPFHAQIHNIVTACAPCNLRKGGRTPREAQMTPFHPPEQPSMFVLQQLGRRFPPNYLHESWVDWLYWDIELEP